MTDYSLYLKPSARKELDALKNPVFDRIDKKIMALAANPRPSGSKKLHGHRGHWRIRVGDYRVVYILDDANRRIDVTRVAHRKDVYQ